jgi:hypothetical protein
MWDSLYANRQNEATELKFRVLIHFGVRKFRVRRFSCGLAVRTRSLNWTSNKFVQMLTYRSSPRVLSMIDPNKIPELVETSLTYIVAAVAAWLAFLLGWLVCAVAGR